MCRGRGKRPYDIVLCDTYAENDDKEGEKSAGKELIGAVCGFGPSDEEKAGDGCAKDRGCDRGRESVAGEIVEDFCGFGEVGNEEAVGQEKIEDSDNCRSMER